MTHIKDVLLSHVYNKYMYIIIIMVPIHPFVTQFMSLLG
jgi:hypothetical protein